MFIKGESVSIIIPTYNRPDELGRCIESILGQTVIPGELIIVDDGSLHEHPFREKCKDMGMRYIYIRKETPGVTASRNAGIGAASGDIVFFFDDDVVLFPDYIEQVLKVYDDDRDGRVGGVGGAIDNCAPISVTDRLRRSFEILFLVTGRREGKVLPSGFCTNFGDTGSPISVPTDVDFLSGGVSSFRRKVFDGFLFDTTHYLKYGMGEDKDFTYRVSKKYRLVYTPFARLLHMESPVMAPDHYRKARMYINYVYIFFRDHVRRGPATWALFYYALSGYALSRTLILTFSPKKKNLDYMKGTLAGIADIVSGRGGLVN